MSKNIQKIYERGEKLDDLEKRAERIEEGAKVFQKSAKKLKQKSFMENNKMKLLMAGGGAFLILIIVIIILASLGIIWKFWVFLITLIRLCVSLKILVEDNIPKAKGKNINTLERGRGPKMNHKVGTCLSLALPCILLIGPKAEQVVGNSSQCTIYIYEWKMSVCIYDI